MYILKLLIRDLFGLPPSTYAATAAKQQASARTVWIIVGGRRGCQCTVHSAVCVVGVRTAVSLIAALIDRPITRDWLHRYRPRCTGCYAFQLLNWTFLIYFWHTLLDWKVSSFSSLYQLLVISRCWAPFRMNEVRPPRRPVAKCSPLIK